MANKEASVNTLGHKILIVLYFLIPFIPRLRSIDPIGAQWVYFAGVDILGVLFLFSNRKAFQIKGFSKMNLSFWLAYLLFFTVGVFSATYAINALETFGDSARVGATLVGAYVLFKLIREAPQTLFSFIVKAAHICALIVSFQVLNHLLGNFDQIRNNTLLEGTELLFGNRNVTAAYAAVLVPFVLWGVVKHQQKWKVVSLVALFGSLSTVLLIASRSTILSVSVILTIFFIHAFVEGRGVDKLLPKLTKNILPVIGVIALVFLVSTNINRVEKSKPNSLSELIYGTKAREIAAAKKKKNKNVVRSKKANKVGFDSGRLIYFEMAYEDFQNNPVKGVGFGNWNLSQKDAYFLNSRVDRFLYPLRVHNDFLQVLAELGLIGITPFLAMFVILALVLFHLARSHPDNEEGWILITLLLALLVYGIDALLNFPMERTPMQGIFAIIAAVLLGYYDFKFKGVSGESKQEKFIPITLGIGFLIALGSTVLTYNKYKSFITDNYVLADMMNKNLLKDDYAQSYAKVKKDRNYLVDMTSVGRPFEHVLAMYAMNEGKLDEALKHLDKSIKMSPYHYESKMLKAIIYNQKRIDRDSAIYYARQGFENYPSITNNYAILINSYRALKDTLNYFKTIDQRLERFPDDISQWQLKSKRIVSYYKDYDRAVAVIDEGLKQNPGDSTLLRYRDKIKVTDRSDDIRAWYAKAFEYIDEKDYASAKVEFLKILDVTPINQPTLLNLGIIEIKLKQYEEAVEHLSKCIELKKFKDGAPEYNRGLAYERLGQMEKAKKDYTMSKRKGYGLAQKLPASRLNKIDD